MKATPQRPSTCAASAARQGARASAGPSKTEVEEVMLEEVVVMID